MSSQKYETFQCWRRMIIYTNQELVLHKYNKQHMLHGYSNNREGQKRKVIYTISAKEKEVTLLRTP